MTAPPDRSAHGSPLALIARYLERTDLMVALLVFGAIVGIGAALVIPPHFVSTAEFVPQQEDNSTNLSLGGLSAIASHLGVGALGAGTPSDFYGALLRSRELLDPIAQARFAIGTDPAAPDSASLIDILKITTHARPARRLELAVKALNKRLSVDVDDQTGIVSISVDMPTPTIAATVASKLLAAVDSFNRFTRQSEAKTRRDFLEGRVRDARLTLDSIEGALEHFYVVNRTFSSSPALAFEEARLKRELSMAQDLYVNLTQEWEQAQIDAVRDTPTLTLVQIPSVPTKQAWPLKSVMALLGAAVGLIVGIGRITWIDVLPPDSPIREPVRALSAAMLQSLRRMRRRFTA